MERELSDLLAACPAFDEEHATWSWNGQPLPLRITTHRSSVLSPALQRHISSVRAVVLRGDDEVLVVRDPHGHHLLPGGRREPDESLEETLRREVAEETGCAIERPLVIGFMHFQHLASKPAGYPYPYPDFVQVIFGARVKPGSEVRCGAGQFELDVFFRAIDRLDDLNLCRRDKLLLERARSVRHP